MTAQCFLWRSIRPAARLLRRADRPRHAWPVAGGEAKTLRDSKSEENLTGVAFGKRGLLATSSDDSDARLWNIQKRTLVKRLSGHMNGMWGVAFSPDGRWLATAGKRKAGMWQVGENHLPRSFLFFVAPPRAEQKQLTSIAFSPRNWTIFTGSIDGTVRRYQCLFCGRSKQLAPYANARLRAAEGRSPSAGPLAVSLSSCP